MKQKLVDLGATQAFSPIFLDYLNHNAKLKSFINRWPSLKSIGQQLEEKAFPNANRKILVERLESQYRYVKGHEEVLKHIEWLKSDRAFTITTGHQLNIATGPLYFILKIITTINACRELNEQFPDFRFVPVYWMASEDHDIDEIRSFHLFGKKYSWETPQTGPVGRMNVEGLKALFQTMPETVQWLEDAYPAGATLGEATLALVNHLFGQYGLVVLEPDHPGLKEIFKPIIRDDLFNHRANDLVEEQSSRLAAAGYKTQIYPRSINHFYLKQGLRERIIQEDGVFKVNHTDLVFTSDEMEKLILESPETFSPNVVLRPIYQEMILPNLAYVGGPAEVAYWLQLKPVFDHYDMAFPVLMPRNFSMIINKGSCNKLQKLGLDVQSFFAPLEDIKNNFVRQHADNEFNLDPEKSAIRDQFDRIKKKAIRIDQTLEGFIGAEENKTLKGLDNIEKRLKKSEEQKLDISINQITSLKDKLFPSGKLQERVENFLTFQLNNPEFIDQLIQGLHPFDFRMHVFYEE
jgi:bacillithiol biosynthesis cysteine-adding enzyme BshC